MIKAKAAIIILLVSLLTGCGSMRHYTSHTAPAPVSINDTLNIQIADGIPVVLDENGKVISERVKPPIELASPDGNFSAKSIERIQHITIMTIRGSCLVVLASGGVYTRVRLPDNHPYCR
ncbi:MAG: hypothetical protein KZQ77_06545 [Candidatus Thiodiazotropha sp. (ex Notomyrtea botanica)]|nr:hypothetical protein [Candidatus Thiodiazotropha sp. (ex Notomyrtea botanica)]